MSTDPPTLHPLVVELLGAFELDEGQLVLSEATFEAWVGRLRGVPPDGRAAVATDLAVVAARFRREQPQATEWAVQALLFFGTVLVGSMLATRRVFERAGLELSPEALKYVEAAEQLKQAPPPPAGRTRTIDAQLQRTQLRRLR